jgi:hypothetical protein
MNTLQNSLKGSAETISNISSSEAGKRSQLKRLENDFKTKKEKNPK